VVRQIAVFLGLADMLVEHPPASEGMCHLIGYTKHPTHWIVVGQWWGYANDSDNGWSAWFMPKSVHRTSDAAELWLRQLDRDLPPGRLFLDVQEFQN
jgi:hypothetical protein